MNILFKIQASTLAARQRLADPQISTHVEAGQIQVVRVDMTDDNPEPVPVSGWMPVADVCGYLDAMQ